jgi:hypothetical protein
MKLGDMAVHGEWPAKTMKALAVIAGHAHQSYDACSGFPPGASRDKCLFMSLAVRDFLVKIGYRDATVRGCALYVRADDKAGQEIWSLGLGVPGQADIEGKFNGHAVCVVPSLGLMIDMTTYQAIRPHWRDMIPGMTAAPYDTPRPERIIGLQPFAGGMVELDDRTVIVAWLDRPELDWRKSEDFRMRNARRVAVTRAMMEAFGGWTDETNAD